MKGIETTQHAVGRSELLYLDKLYRIVRMYLTAVVDVLPIKTLGIIHNVAYKYFRNSSSPTTDDVFPKYCQV